MTHPVCPEVLRKHLCQNPENSANLKWIIKESNVGGRGLFASEPIKKGSLIFVNNPLIIGPRGGCIGKLYCSICYIMSESCYPCDVCSLLICTEVCKTSQEHAKICALLTQNWQLKDKCKTNDISSRLTIYLQSLLLTEEQRSLLFFLEKSRKYSYNDNDDLETLFSIYSVPKEHMKIMKTVSTVLKANAFRIPDRTDLKTVSLRGLYPLSSLLNHSCTPNTRNVYRKDYSMAVYSTRNIEIGEEIFGCYTGLLWGTPARRCQLFKTKHFWCQCDRCKDPTEMNTKLSALKCLDKNCIGVLLPLNPLDPRTIWRCDNCGAEESPERVSAVQSVLGSLIGTLDLDDQFRLEHFVLERLACFIPYSNHIFVDLRLRLGLKLGYVEGLKLNELSESRLALKESLCRGTLRTVAALGVGDAHLRGLLLYHLHAALAERARRSPHLYEELKPEIESTIEQAYNILQGDISAPLDLELRRRYLGPGCDKSQEERFFILDS